MTTKFIDFPGPGDQTVTINPDQVCQMFHDESLSPWPTLIDLGSGEPQAVTLALDDVGTRLGIPLAKLDGVNLGAGGKPGTVLIVPAQVTMVREAQPKHPEAGSLVHFGNARHRTVTQSRKDAVDRIKAAASATKDTDA